MPRGIKLQIVLSGEKKQATVPTVVRKYVKYCKNVV